MLDPSQLKDLILKAGITGLLAFILVSGYFGYWIFGKTYEDTKASYEKQLVTLATDRDEWKKTALDGLKVIRNVSPLKPVAAAGPLNSELSASEVRDLQQTFDKLNEK